MQLLIILKYLLYGWIILLVAIVVNFAAGSIGLKTWYDYLNTARETGMKTATTNLSIPEILFLFIIYPGIFGLIIYLIYKLSAA